ncbi:alpha/beta-hydrolase [Thelephora ganbajun]|uniref:Alpha/beta-hydrolase n=1 Tax=Thelephora ganbajun TaxID=370292 RepID=A0ACB6Z653_THEGA|nr:alpha/beta-hydrolase [Thelephora ganbajun]
MLHSTGLTALLTLGLLAKRVVAVPTSTPRSDPSISWGGCGSLGINATDPNLQCGYLEVPMDYHDNFAGNARLAVIKYAATAKKLGTIFFNPGGPGGSGLKAITGSGHVFSRGFQGAFDVVSWDPRGVGHTFPGEVYCFNNTEEDAGFWKHTPVSYINETIAGKFDKRDLDELYSQVDLTERKFKQFAAHCLNGSAAPYFKYLGTSSTVRDLVSLGDAIVGKGEPIDYWGISYGTVLGFNFLNMFPERAGHVILDGVVDPTAWTSYKLLRLSLADAEKTHSGLTDGCAKAGRAGCKLIEFTGDNASGDDVKTLLDYAHDVILELYRDGYSVPLAPGFIKAELFNLLYSPTIWSQYVNSYVYDVVALALQASRAHNITVPGGHKYKVPSGNVTINRSFLSLASVASSPNLTSYTSMAISGADDFNDDNTKIKDIFDIIVDTTREVTSTFGTIWGLGYTSSGWPTRSVERLPPYSPKELKTPVLVIGNTADPITPLAGAKSAAKLLGDNAFLVEQLGFGHTSLAQASSCTLGIIRNYFANSVLPQERSTQCPVDDPDLFPALNGTTTVARRSDFLHRWW